MTLNPLELVWDWLDEMEVEMEKDANAEGNSGDEEESSNDKNMSVNVDGGKLTPNVFLISCCSIEPSC